MMSRVFLLIFRREGPSRGFSLVELLVTLLITSVMMTVMASFMQTVVSTRQIGEAETEAQQGLRALIVTITQELRQAGACLPAANRALALEGTDDGDQDTLTLRIGRVDDRTTVCINPVVVTRRNPPLLSFPPPAAGDGKVNVPDATLFRPGELVYITPNGAVGAYYTVTGGVGTMLSLNSPLVNFGPDVPYGDPSGGSATQVFAIEERTYAVDASDPARPMLTVAIDQGAPQPFIAGIEIFDVKYHLGPCSTTDTCAALVDQPLPNQWGAVAKVALKASVRSLMKDKTGAFHVATTGQPGQKGEFITIKPRNFL